MLRGPIDRYGSASPEINQEIGIGDCLDLPNDSVRTVASLDRADVIVPVRSTDRRYLQVVQRRVKSPRIRTPDRRRYGTACRLTPRLRMIAVASQYFAPSLTGRKIRWRARCRPTGVRRWLSPMWAVPTHRSLGEAWSPVWDAVLIAVVQRTVGDDVNHACGGVKSEQCRVRAL